MPPKNKSAAAVAKPIVSETDLAAARKLLESADEKKRQKSNLDYFLKKNGITRDFDRKSATAKREYLEAWFGARLAETRGKLNSTVTESFGSSHESQVAYSWMSKQALIDQFGEKKAMNKINSGKLATQPDPDTGLDGEWDVEYKVFAETGKDVESRSEAMKLEQERSHDTEEDQKTALSEFHCSRDAIASDPRASSASGARPGSILGNPATIVKIEGAAMSGDAVGGKSQEELELDKCTARVKDSKKLLRTIGDMITNTKEMYESSKDERILETLHNDIKVFLPKAANLFKKIERYHLDQKTADDAVILALAQSLKKHEDEFETIQTWFKNLTPKQPAAKKPKVA
jgi:hypothetical protein